MTIRTHLALAFVIAPCMLAMAATDAAAGPLPLEVLGPMRARTLKLIDNAHQQTKLLDMQAEEAFETFAKETANPKALKPGVYEQLLGDYYQTSAEISAQRAAQEAIGSVLSTHLADIEQQIHAWRVMGVSDDEISARLQVVASPPRLTVSKPVPGRFPPTE